MPKSCQFLEPNFAAQLLENQFVARLLCAGSEKAHPQYNPNKAHFHPNTPPVSRTKHPFQQRSGNVLAILVY